MAGSTEQGHDGSDDGQKVKTLGAEVSVEFYDLIDDVARERYMSKSALIRSILHDHFDYEGGRK